MPTEPKSISLHYTIMDFSAGVHDGHDVICTRKLILTEGVAEFKIIFFGHITLCAVAENDINVLLYNQSILY